MTERHKYVCDECGEHCELNTTAELTKDWVGLCWMVGVKETAPFEVSWQQTKKRGG